MGTLTVHPARVAADASSLVVYNGAPYKSIAWSLTGGGTLTVLSTMTNESGAASAVYHPGTIGDTVSVGVTVGT